MGVSMMMLFPLTFVSNVFVDPATMPEWLRSIVDGNPISHLATAVRGLMAGNVDGAEVAMVLFNCAVLISIFGPVTSILYRRK